MPSAPTNLPHPAVDLKEVSTQLVTAFGLLVAIAFFSFSESAITTLWPWKVGQTASTRLAFVLVGR